MLSRLTRRHFLQSSLILTSSTLLSSCSNQPTKSPAIQPTPSQSSMNSHSTNNTIHLFASSGFCEDSTRVQRGINLLNIAGFTVNNTQAAYRRFQRFAGSDSERINDFQQLLQTKQDIPKILMGVRGGYGASRLLPYIDWASLGDKMREQQTLLFGFSDVTAIQLALLAKGNMPSFTGPMLYSDFGKPSPSPYTMDSFTRTITQTKTTINVPFPQISPVQSITGTLWGGNLSMIASLVGSPYMPNIRGGILFLEDVSEQPYRIERMLQTLHLSGILQQQQAIILGDFRMNNIRDVYDSNYDFNTVIRYISQIIKLPIYTNFPFGHIANKATFPLGAQAEIKSDNQGGYLVEFNSYPMLRPTQLNLTALISNNKSDDTDTIQE